MAAPVVHFEVNARDAKRAQEFYAELFGWKINTNNPIGYGVVDTGLKMGINGGIGQIEGDKPPFVTFYAQVEDPQAYLDKAVSLGATVITPVTEIPNMITYALFSDPEGNRVGVVKGPQSLPRAKPRKAISRKPVSRKKKASRKRRR